MAEPTVEIKRRRPSTHRKRNWTKAMQPVYRAHKAHLKQPVRCSSCRTWKELDEFWKWTPLEGMRRMRTCKTCRPTLAKRAPELGPAGGDNPAGGAHKLQDVNPQILTSGA